MLYLTVGSMLVMPLLHLPFILINLPILLTQDIQRLIPQLSFLLMFTGIPLLVLFGIYQLSKMIKDQYIFFVLVFLLISLVSYFNFTTRFILTDSNNAWKPLLLGIPLGVFFSFMLTYFWKRIILLKKYREAQFLRVPLLLVLIVLFAETVSHWFLRDSLLLMAYIVVGDFLMKFGVNIFYIDYYGFVGIFLSLLTSTISLVMLKLKDND